MKARLSQAAAHNASATEYYHANGGADGVKALRGTEFSFRVCELAIPDNCKVRLRTIRFHPTSFSILALTLTLALTLALTLPLRSPLWASPYMQQQGGLGAPNGRSASSIRRGRTFSSSVKQTRRPSWTVSGTSIEFYSIKETLVQ